MLSLEQNQNILFIDVETTTRNKGHPFDPRNFLVSYAYAINNSDVIFKYYTDADFISTLLDIMASAGLVVNFAIKFDLNWASRHDMVLSTETIVWDCQLAEFILSGQTLPYDSLNEACERYGIPVKHDAVSEYWAAGVSTEDIPRDVLEEYNKHDVYITRLLYQTQQQICSEVQRTLIELEGHDLKALAAAEQAGIKFDVDGAKDAISRYSVDLSAIHEKLDRYLPDALPTGCFNWDSGDHLSLFLYGGSKEFRYVQSLSHYKSGEKMGQERKTWATQIVNFERKFMPLADSEVAKTKDIPAQVECTRYYQTDVPTIKQLKANTKDKKQILALLLERSDKIKVVEMLQGIINKMVEKNWQDNLIHGQFNQNVVITGRLSSSQPNLQNQPPEIDQYFISRYA